MMHLCMYRENEEHGAQGEWDDDFGHDGRGPVEAIADPHPQRDGRDQTE